MEKLYRIAHLEEAEEIAELLSAQFPDPQKARLGLYELLLNAIEHGNLGITYEEKSHLLAAGMWRQEVTHRASLPENRQKRTTLQLVRFNNSLNVHIRDEGRGFNWQYYLRQSAERLHHSHGRGIALAYLYCFDRLAYSAIGNEVTASVLLEEPASSTIVPFKRLVIADNKS